MQTLGWDFLIPTKSLIYAHFLYVYNFHLDIKSFNNQLKKT